MQLGPDKYYKCPNCGAYLYTHTLLSGNTFGARVYSDGKMVAPMLPEYPNLTKCGGCGTIVMLKLLKPLSDETPHQPQQQEVELSLWGKLKNIVCRTKSEAEKLQECEVLQDDETRATNRPHECNHLGIDDLYKALALFPGEELYIRLKIWRAYNDEYRYSEDELFVMCNKFNIDHINCKFLDSKEYQSNCLALLSLLNKNNPKERILLAELYRNLGNFKECMELIHSATRNGSTERLHTVECNRHGGFSVLFADYSVERILALDCEKGNRNTVRIDNYYEILEGNAKREAERKEVERINEEMKDPCWKICPNGHCYENIRKECPWCGKDNVVGRLDKDVSLQHKDLYVGKQNGHYILTSDASIPMQEDRIRKITIDYYQDKFIYFHMDGKNPHPFYFNIIRLDQGSIKGRVLTKYIELIMIGKCDDVDLSSYIERHDNY